MAKRLQAIGNPDYKDGFVFKMLPQRLDEPKRNKKPTLDLRGIDWVIAGGESGASARAMKEEWVLNIKRQCEAQNVAFFFKQWGAWGSDGVKRSKKENGALLGGKTYQAYPKIVQKIPSLF